MDSGIAPSARSGMTANSSDRERAPKKIMKMSLAQCSAIGAMLAAMLAAGMTAPSTSAQSVEEFYKGKTLQINVGFGVGASYDIYARVLAEHIGRHVPGNPKTIVMNMEGAGSLRLANWLYNAAPKDGTVFGTTSRAAPFASLIGTQGGTSFDPTQFNWIGSANNEVSTCVSWHTATVKTFDQLRSTELIIGGDGPSADGEQFARVMNALSTQR
jgi:tripartite-type tricarboxylate transporter receptor subunit TctC